MELETIISGYVFDSRTCLTIANVKVDLIIMAPNPQDSIDSNQVREQENINACNIESYTIIKLPTF